MSIQFNFFGIGSDHHLIGELILGKLPGLLALPESGAPDALVPRPMKHASDLHVQGGGTIALVLPAALGSVRTRETPRGVRIDFRESPAIEYSSSLDIDSQTVRVGRLAYFFEEDPGMKSAVLALVRCLKKRARRVPGKSGFWIFEEAARRAALLQYWVGSPGPNPLRAMSS